MLLVARPAVEPRGHSAIWFLVDDWLQYNAYVLTTGDSCFAECLRHSAKALLLSAKALPSAALGKGPSANFKSAKGSLPSAFYRVLGKGFAECLPGGTRQRKVTVMTGYKLTVALPSVSKKGIRQRIFLKKIPNFCAECLARRHSIKKFGIFLKKNSLPSVPEQDTRQRN